jgi:ribosomal protein S18 acetylase RimI-like enzyme
MTIRCAQPADAQAIAQLHAFSWQTAYRGILRDDFLDGPVIENRRVLWNTRLADSHENNQIIVLDEQDGKIRGFACAFLDADPQWGTLLDNLHVAPKLKGKGLGRQLMSVIANRILQAGARRQLHLWAYEQNVLARRFYEGLGGVVCGSQAELAPDGTCVDAVCYGWRQIADLAASQLANREN